LPGLQEELDKATKAQDEAYKIESKAWGPKKNDSPRDQAAWTKAMRELEIASRVLFARCDHLTNVQKQIKMLRSETTVQERVRQQEEMFS